MKHGFDEKSKGTALVALLEELAPGAAVDALKRELGVTDADISTFKRANFREFQLAAAEYAHLKAKTYVHTPGETFRADDTFRVDDIPSLIRNIECHLAAGKRTLAIQEVALFQRRPCEPVALAFLRRLHAALEGPRVYEH